MALELDTSAKVNPGYDNALPPDGLTPTATKSVTDDVLGSSLDWEVKLQVVMSPC